MLWLNVAMGRKAGWLWPWGKIEPRTAKLRRDCERPLHGVEWWRRTEVDMRGGGPGWGGCDEDKFLINWLVDFA